MENSIHHTICRWEDEEELEDKERYTSSTVPSITPIAASASFIAERKYGGEGIVETDEEGVMGELEEKGEDEEEAVYKFKLLLNNTTPLLRDRRISYNGLRFGLHVSVITSPELKRNRGGGIRAHAALGNELLFK